MNTKKIKFKSLIFFLITTVILNITSCNKNEEFDTKKTTFQDEKFQAIVASAFNKTSAELTSKDYDDITGIDVYYYAERVSDVGNEIQYKDVWSVTLFKNGYHEAYDKYYSVDEDKRDGLISPYEFTYNDKLDNFTGYQDLINFKNVRDISFNSEYSVIEINPISFIAHMRSLESLSIYNFVVPSLNVVSNFTNLKKISVGLNLRQVGDDQKIEYITDISPLSYLKKLESISLTGAYFEDFTPLSKLNKLTSLSVSMGGLSDISSISELKSLEYVNLYYNGISDVTPLTKLPKLKNIILDYNYITDVSPFASLNPEVVEYVSLDMNSIDDVTPLKHLGKDKVYVGYDLYWD